MKITVIGCGNAFSSDNFNQSFLVEEDGRKMLIDCGYQVPVALQVNRVDYREINDIYISHLHADHVGGLEYFAFQKYDWAKKPRMAPPSAPRIIGNEDLLHNLWEKSLRGGLESMEGFVSTMDTFFHTLPIEPNQPFEWQGWTVSLIQQIHIMSGSVIMPSFGIIFERVGHQTVYFVTDSQHCSPRQIEDFYNKSDIIFQDAEFVGIDMSAPESADHGRFKFGSGVHASYAQLAGYPSANSIKLGDDIRAKMWLSHYQDFVPRGKDMYGNSVDWDEEIKKDGFAGRVRVGQVFEV
jgi:ribonuclease BN (tRNA processing enzyme)